MKDLEVAAGTLKRHAVGALLVVLLSLPYMNSAAQQASGLVQSGPKQGTNTTKTTPAQSSSMTLEERLPDILEKAGFVLLGTLLSLVVLMYQTRTSKKKERRVTMVKRLEEVFSLSEATQRWAEQLMLPIGDALAGKSREPAGEQGDSPAPRILMLSRLYEPDLVGAAESLNEKCAELSKLHGDIIYESIQRGLRGTGKQPMLDLGPKAIGDMVQIVAGITTRSKDLKLAAEKAMRKYI